MVSQANFFLTVQLAVVFFFLNWLVIGIWFISIYWLLWSPTLCKQLQKCFTVLPKRQNNYCTLKVVTLYPKPKFLISCENGKDLVWKPACQSFQPSSDLFQKVNSPFFNLWVCWVNFKMKSMIHCVCLKADTETLLAAGERPQVTSPFCASFTSMRWRTESVKCFRTNKNCSIMCRY